MMRNVGLIVIGLALVAVSTLGLRVPGVAESGPRPRIQISVTDVGSGQPIKDGQELTVITSFRVTVTTTGDCAGQFVVTALGAPGGPPSVLVQPVAYIIGPAAGSNSVTGGTLNSGIQNAWKVSASCNGASKNDFDFDAFEFTVNVP